MDKSLFRYIWRHSHRDQIIICTVVLLSLPFYYFSLDLPRRIVNEAIQGNAFTNGKESVRFLVISFDWPQWLGGGTAHLFDGFSVGRIGLLLDLSLLFLFFVLVNGAFKYWINLAKGALGERMLRRMRFELFNCILRFRPEALKYVKSAETATIIKDEVEPIGGFIGDAFILPMFLGAQAATALIFIVIQSQWLGLMAVAMVGVQLIVIPRMRRKLLTLGRQRQLASRRFAGRISEVFDGQETILLHNTGAWERAEIGGRLYELFDVRFQIYKRKFVVKFLNNILAQMTPFFFYAIGGYFAITGRMDIGQLVAVIGAYRDLPPPLKELIDWDQQRLDVQVKYDQVVQQFAPERLFPSEGPPTEAPDPVELGSPLKVFNLRVVDNQGVPVLNNLSFEVPLPSRIALLNDGTFQAGALARTLARPERCGVGRVVVGDVELAALPRDAWAKDIAYFGGEPVLFPGSIRDNLIYGLKSRYLGPTEETPRLRSKRQMEASKTGNPVERVDDQWIDYSAAGASNQKELDRILLSYLRDIGLSEDIYRFGQSGSFDPEQHPLFAERLVKARKRLRTTLLEKGLGHLVEIFDINRYNNNATIAENLLFGLPTRSTLTGHRLAEHAGFCRELNHADLTDVFISLGGRIAETMVEIFHDLPPGHPLFEQFSFVSADELDEYGEIVRRWARRRKGLSRGERSQLLALALGYVEPRHRLGLLNDDIRRRVVDARNAIRAMLEKTTPGGVEFYDENEICRPASLRDNILFGRIDLGVANARGEVAEALRIVIEEMDLREPIERIGLSHQVGAAGRLLTAQQRFGIDLVRCLVKRPYILIVDSTFSPFTNSRKHEMLELLQRKSLRDETALIVTVPEGSELKGFDFAVKLLGDHAIVQDVSPAAALPDGAHEPRQVTS